MDVAYNLLYLVSKCAFDLKLCVFTCTN